MSWVAGPCVAHCPYNYFFIHHTYRIYRTHTKYDYTYSSVQLSVYSTHLYSTTDLVNSAPPPVDGRDHPNQPTPWLSHTKSQASSAPPSPPCANMARPSPPSSTPTCCAAIQTYTITSTPPTCPIRQQSPAPQE